MQLTNGARFLNATSLFLLSVNLASTNCASFLPTGGPAFPVIAIFPSASLYASL